LEKYSLLPLRSIPVHSKTLDYGYHIFLWIKAELFAKRDFNDCPSSDLFVKNLSILFFEIAILAGAAERAMQILVRDSEKPKSENCDVHTTSGDETPPNYESLLTSKTF